MSNTQPSPKTAVHHQRRERLARKNLRVEDNLVPEPEDQYAVAETGQSRGRRLKAEELGVSEDRDMIRIGMTEQARRPIDWDASDGAGLLVMGYGVPHTSYLLQSVVAHYRHHEVPIYGLDFMDLLSNYPKGSFASLYSHRRTEAVELLERLTGQDTEQVLILTQLGTFLNPTNSTMTAEAQAGLHADIIRLLLQLINDDHTHVFITTSKLKTEADLPQAIVDAFPSKVLAGKIFAKEATRLITEADKTRSDKGSIHHSLLITPDRSEMFQNARVNLIRNY